MKTGVAGEAGEVEELEVLLQAASEGSEDIRLERSLRRIREAFNKKSRIRETKNLSTDADSSTDTTVGWTKNTQKPNFFFIGKTQKRLEICLN